MIKAKHDGQYKQVGFIKVRQPDGTYKDVEKKYGKINGGEYGLVFEKGFNREVEGELPLTLNSIGKPLKDYTIEGNTYQPDGVTPDTPQEVKAVGDKTGNLFDKNDCTVEGYINLNGNISAAAHWFTTENYIKCSGTITVTTLNGLGSGAYITCYDEQKNLLGVCRITDTNQNQSTINLIDGTKYIKTCCRDDNFDSFMLNSGSTPLPYEPYGYKVDVVTRGKNLFDISTIEAGRIDDTGEVGYISQTSLAVSGNTITFSTTSTWRGFVSDYIEINGIKPIISYGSFTSNENAVFTGFLYYYDADKQYLGNMSEYLSNAKYARISFQADVIVTNAVVSDIQLELGTEATEYEPYVEPITTPIYLDSPLYKIGDYSDSRGMTEEVRAVKELVLTGDESYVYDVLYSRFFFKISDLLGQGVRLTQMLCTHYQVIYDGRDISDVPNNAIYTGGGVDINTLFIKTSDYTTVDDFNSYLAAQYSAGTPVKVYYVLAEPTVKTVDAVEIPTIQGTNIIDIKTEVKPSNVYIKYKSKT